MMSIPRPAHLDFDLRIAAEQDGSYEAVLLSSPAGAASRNFALPAPSELAAMRDRLDGAVGGQPGRSLSLDDAEVFGAQLFEAVFADSILQAYDQSLSIAAAQGANLRLRLRIVDPLLASLPWELIFDGRERRFLALASSTVLLRAVESLNPPQSLILEPPLHVLAMGASPAGLPLVNLEAEKERLFAAFAPLGEAADVEWLDGQDWRSLQEALQRKPRHLLHFVGHGTYDPHTHQGYLAFAGENDAADPRPAEDMALLLAGHPSLRLVVLNACEGAKNTSGSRMDAGVAALLVERGVPAVLAMQHPIEARLAAEFSRSFYTAAGNGLPFDAACAEARKALRLSAPTSLQWATPVLLLRNAEGPVTPYSPRRWDGRRPYVGLQAFQEHNAPFFFGRQALVEDLANRLAQERFLCVSGPSGSGKSSLVQAGLLPALKRGRLSGSESWLYALLAPGAAPIEQLALALARLTGNPSTGDYVRSEAANKEALHLSAETLLPAGSNGRLLLYVDQFEELFNPAVSEAQRTRFLDLLTTAVGMPEGRVTTVITLRSDFVTHYSAYAELSALSSGELVLVGALKPEELAQAVVQPALKVGVSIEPELTEQIGVEMAGEAGALPLMQFALKDLFDDATAAKRKGDAVTLSLTAYFDRGGLHKALENHAERVFATLSKEQKELARLLFGRLVEVGRGTPDTRRIAGMDELVNLGDKRQVEAVIAVLSQARLLTTGGREGGERTVEVMHEKLLVAWPWLDKLIDENRETIQLQNTIERDADEWVHSERDTSHLYGAARLALIQEARQRLLLSKDAADFLDAGQAEVDRRQAELEALRQRELIQARKARNRLGWLLAAAVALLVVFIGAGLWIQNQNRELEVQTIQAQVNALSARARAAISAEKPEPELALTYAISAVNEAQGAVQSVRLTAEEALHYVLRYSRLTATTSVPAGVQLGATALSPDRDLLAVGASDGSVRLWPTDESGALGPPTQVNCYPARVVDVALGGPYLAIAYEADMVCLWDLEQNRRTSLERLGTVVALSPDGSLLAAGGAQPAVDLWNLTGTQVERRDRFTVPGGAISDLAFDGSGGYLAAATNNSVVWRDVAGASTLWQPPALVTQSQLNVGRSVTRLAVSPDAQWIAAGVDGDIHLWRQGRDADGLPTFALFDRWPAHVTPIGALVFDGSGGCLASAADEPAIKVWDLNLRRRPLLLVGHDQPVGGLAFWSDGQAGMNTAYPCGAALYSAAADATLRTWDLGPSRDHHTAAVFTKPVESTAFHPDPVTPLLAAADDSGNVTVVDYHTGETVWQAALHSARANAVAFSPPDGRWLASGGYDDQVILVDPRSGTEPQVLSGHQDDVLALAFAPDGELLASAGRDTFIRLWNVRTQQEAFPPISVPDEIWGMAFSPSGELLAAAGSNDVRIWQVADPQHTLILNYHNLDERIRDVEFLDENTLITGGDTGAVYVWQLAFDTKLMTEPQHTWPLDSGAVTELALSRDGSRLAASTQYGEAILLDTRTWQDRLRLGADRELGNLFNSVALSPDGQYLAAAVEANAVHIYRLSPTESLLALAAERLQFYTGAAIVTE